MTRTRTKSLARGVWTLFFTFLAAPELIAQRLVLPEGSVIIVRTSTPLESSSAIRCITTRT